MIAERSDVAESPALLDEAMHAVHGVMLVTRLALLKPGDQLAVCVDRLAAGTWVWRRSHAPAGIVDLLEQDFGLVRCHSHLFLLAFSRLFRFRHLICGEALGTGYRYHANERRKSLDRGSTGGSVLLPWAAAHPKRLGPIVVYPHPGRPDP